MKSFFWILLKTTLTLLCLACAAYLFLTSIFFFDAPGSDKNILNYWLMAIVTFFPASFIPFIWKRKLWFIPLLGILLVVAGFFALEYFCNGMFSCGYS